MGFIMSKSKLPIAVGIVGLGRAGWGMQCKELEKRKKTFRIAAGCDPIAKRRRQMVDTYGAKAYKTIEELVADPEIELVSIATPSTEHVDHALLALAAGKKVIVEKPLAISYDEARRLVKGAGKNKANLFVRHNRRFEGAFNDILDIVKSGLIGDLFEIKLRRLGYARRDDWQTLMSRGGGQLLNWGPHIVDHALHFLESPVKQIWTDLRKIAAMGDAEDHVRIILRGENGRVADLEISGGCAIRQPVYWLAGTRGALTSNDEQTIELRYLDPKVKLPPRRLKTGVPEYGSFGTRETLPWVTETREVRKDLNIESIWDELYETIRNGKPFRVTLEESLEVMRVLSQARKGTAFENIG